MPAPALHAAAGHHARSHIAPARWRPGDDQAAAAATGEAAGITARLGCQPLLDRADSIQATMPRAAAW